MKWLSLQLYAWMTLVTAGMADNSLIFPATKLGMGPFNVVGNVTADAIMVIDYEDQPERIVANSISLINNSYYVSLRWAFDSLVVDVINEGYEVAIRDVRVYLNCPDEYAQLVYSPGEYRQYYYGLGVPFHTNLPPSMPVFATLNCLVPPTCGVSVSSLDFGTEPPSTAVERVFTITNTGGGILTGEVLEACDEYTVTNSNYSLGGGESQTVTVTFQSGISGTFPCTLDAGGSCSDISMTSTAQVPPACEMSTANLDFGTVEPGTIVERMFTITNSGGGTLTGVVMKDCDAYTVTNGSYSLGQGMSQTVTVTFQSATIGRFPCTLDTGGSCADLSLTASVLLVTEPFNHNGALAPGWSVQSAARSTPWAPVQEAGADWAVQTTHTAFEPEYDETLISPVYDLTWWEDVSVGFTHTHVPAGGDAAFRSSANGGLSWTTRRTWTTPAAGDTAFDVSSWADGNPYARFSFRFRSLVPQGGSSWRVDDFFLNGIPAAPQATLPVPDPEAGEDWAQLTGSIGCHWHQPLGVVGDSLQVRVDANGDGDYNDGGVELWTALPAQTSGSDLDVLTTVVFPGNGSYAFEFRAKSPQGRWGYSGTARQEGAADDWLVNVAVAPPSASLPVPAQPMGTPWYTLSGQLGCTWSHPLGVDGSSLSIRRDENGDGDYLDGGAEDWTALAAQPNATSISVLANATWAQNGSYKFELKAKGVDGTFGYSGTAGTNGPADDWLIQISIPPICHVNTSQLDFGQVVQGRAATAFVVICNQGGEILTGLVTESSPDVVLSNESYMLAAGQCQTVLARLTPVLPGTFECWLNLGANCDSIRCIASVDVANGLDSLHAIPINFDGSGFAQIEGNTINGINTLNDPWSSALIRLGDWSRYEQEQYETGDGVLCPSGSVTTTHIYNATESNDIWYLINDSSGMMYFDGTMFDGFNIVLINRNTGAIELTSTISEFSFDVDDEDHYLIIDGYYNTCRIDSHDYGWRGCTVGCEEVYTVHNCGMEYKTGVYNVEMNKLSGVLVASNFNSEVLPAGWTLQGNGSPSAAAWHPIQEYGADWAMESVHEDLEPALDEWLIGPITDLSVWGQIQVEFDQRYLHDGSEAALYISPSGGAGWETLQSWTASTQGISRVALPAWADANPNTRIAFRFQAQDGVGLSSWSVDDVRVTGTPRPPRATAFSSGPNPSAWLQSTGELGCVWIQPLGVRGDSLQVRVDMNADGDYIDDGAENWTLLPAQAFGDSVTVRRTVSFTQNGLHHVEFRAKAISGNWGYSGSNGEAGIVDDWGVLVDMEPPIASAPVPSTTAPSWMGWTGTIGCTFSHPLGVQGNSLAWRVDANADEDYNDGGLEDWHTVTAQSNAGTVTGSAQVSLVGGAGEGRIQFEWKAQAVDGLIGYSGSQQAEGTGDDWVIFTPPVASEPVPSQPLTESWTSLSGDFGCTWVHPRGIRGDSLQARVDFNGDGDYADGGLETWWNLPAQSDGSRLSVNAAVTFARKGSRRFELRAQSMDGAWGYTGSTATSGPGDDWTLSIVLPDIPGETKAHPIPLGTLAEGTFHLSGDLFNYLDDYQLLDNFGGESLEMVPIPCGLVGEFENQRFARNDVFYSFELDTNRTVSITDIPDVDCSIFNSDMSLVGDGCCLSKGRYFLIADGNSEFGVTIAVESYCGETLNSDEEIAFFDHILISRSTSGQSDDVRVSRGSYITEDEISFVTGEYTRFNSGPCVDCFGETYNMTKYLWQTISSDHTVLVNNTLNSVIGVNLSTSAGLILAELGGINGNCVKQGRKFIISSECDSVINYAVDGYSGYQFEKTITAECHGGDCCEYYEEPCDHTGPHCVRWCPWQCYQYVSTIFDQLHSTNGSFVINLINIGNLIYKERFSSEFSLTGWFKNLNDGISDSLAWHLGVDGVQDLAATVIHVPDTPTQDCWLSSPVLDLQWGEHLQMGFSQGYTHDRSAATVLASQNGGQSWEPLLTFTHGTRGDTLVALPAWADRNPQVRLAFQFQSTDPQSQAQWVVDDVFVAGTPIPPVGIQTASSQSVWSQLRGNLSCTWIQPLMVRGDTLQVRVDLNGDGDYADGGMENWVLLPPQASTDTLLVQASITCPGDGIYAYEFRAKSGLGQWGYSGVSGLEGITDDWTISVVVDAGAPVFTAYLPSDYDSPVWTSALVRMVGCQVSDSIAVDGNRLAYRVDLNQDGLFGEGEDFQALPAQVSGPRIVVSREITLPTDGEYLVQFRAYDVSGNGSESAVIRLRADTTPPTVSNLFVSGAGATAVEMIFSPAQDLSFQSYELHVSTDADVSLTDPIWGPLQDPALSQRTTQQTTVAGLLPGTAYWFKLWARDAAGNVNAGSNVIHKVTGGSPVAAILDLHAVQTPGGVLLSWTAPTTDEDGYAPVAIEQYAVHASDTPWFTPSSEMLVGTTTTPEFLVSLPRTQVLQAYYQVVTVGSGVGAPVGGMERVEPGSFTMGPDALGQGAAHPVTLTHPFWMDRVEVTNQDYLTALQWALGQGLVTATAISVTAHGVELLDLDDIDCEIAFNPATQQFSLVARSHSWLSDGILKGPGIAYPTGYNPARHPVKEMTWYGAACYCDWRSLQENLTPFYNGNWATDASHDPYTAEGYRLPTEAEWEYAARYNDGRLYPWGNTEPVGCEIANLNCIGWTKPVGLYPQGDNQLGQKDLVGNALEFINDRYATGYSGSAVNPIGPSTGTSRACRGSDCGNAPLVYAQATTRQSYSSQQSQYWIGFRTVRCEEEPPAPVQAYPGVLIEVPAGSFMMGQLGVAEPVHQVTLTHSFQLGQTEVTNAEFRAVALWAVENGHAELSDGILTAHGQVLGNIPVNENSYPVAFITWFGAASYCDWLSIKMSLIPFYSGNWNPNSSHNPYSIIGYRLPTEAEWEYAARYIDGRTYPWGNSIPVPCYNGNIFDCNGYTTTLVGSYPGGMSNLGFYDMAGNVWEWCNDWLSSHTNEAQIDPYGSESASWRCFRGGGWGDNVNQISCASINGYDPNYKYANHGFRVCYMQAY